MANNEHYHIMKTYQSIVIGIVIGFLAGVGTMQASLIGDVRDHTTRIAHIENDAKAQNANLNDQMNRMIRLMEGLIETNRELIAKLNAKP